MGEKFKIGGLANSCMYMHNRAIDGRKIIVCRLTREAESGYWIAEIMQNRTVI